ncbi:MAG: hypothetical protein ACR2FU_10170 [Streptosporangiaceae bacterium]
MADFSDLEFMQRGRRLVVGVVMLLVGGVVGFALPHSNASPSSQKGSILSVGNATTNAGMTFEFRPVKGKTETFRWQPATPWQKTPASHWKFKGKPWCLVAGNTAAMPATVGVVNVAGTGSAPGRSVVVWVECYV